MATPRRPGFDYSKAETFLIDATAMRRRASRSIYTLPTHSRILRPNAKQCGVACQSIDLTGDGMGAASTSCTSAGHGRRRAISGGRSTR